MLFQTRHIQTGSSSQSKRIAPLSSRNPRQRFEDIVRNIDAITNTRRHARWQKLFLFHKRFSDLAGAVDEELRNRADCAVFQSDKTNVAGRHLKIDLEGPQSKVLALEPQS